MELKVYLLLELIQAPFIQGGWGGNDNVKYVDREQSAVRKNTALSVGRNGF